ncbi:MAG: immunity 26/phosphotriesterase HocA family protein [Armatimonadetes bacterium]|nr:immunity 26/phosphotriesterase HocA family protein [Armatimonadota bacterium]
MKRRKSDFETAPGTCFVIPLRDGTFAPGVVLIQSDNALKFIACAPVRVAGDISPREILNEISESATVRGALIGPTGFTIGGWMVRGHVEVIPTQLLGLPLIQLPPHERAMSINPQSLEIGGFVEFGGNVSRLPFYSVGGHEFISGVIYRELEGMPFAPWMC